MDRARDEEVTRRWTTYASSRGWACLLLMAVAYAGTTIGEVQVYPKPEPVAPPAPTTKSRGPQPSPPLPAPVDASSLYRVDVLQDGQTYSSFVYEVRSLDPDWRGVGDENIHPNVFSFTTFSFFGPVTVEVTKLAGDPITSCRIYPSSYEIMAEIVAPNKVRFAIERPMKKMAVIFNGDWTTHPLLVFADPLETNVPHPGDPGVIYFGPGVHDAGIIYPAWDDGTAYIAGGAYVRGAINTGGMARVTIRGRGVLSQEGMAQGEARSIDLGTGGTDTLVEGITITQMVNWCITWTGERTVMRNVKVVGAWMRNNDGPATSSDGIIEDCFFSCGDNTMKLINGPSVVRRNVYWQVSHGGIYLISWNRGADVSGFHIYDEDIIRTDYWWDPSNPAVFFAHHGGSGNLSAYLFENIRIENCNWRLFHLRVDSFGGGNQPQGRISNIQIRNVTATDCSFDRPGLIRGWDSVHGIKDVTIENFVLNGQIVDRPEQTNTTVDPCGTANIRFLSTPPSGPLAWYPFERSARDKAQGFHGTMHGASLGDGHVGRKAAHFDGVDDWIEIPCCVRDSFTLAFWVRTTQNPLYTYPGEWYEGYGLIGRSVGAAESDFGASVVSGRLAFGVGGPGTTVKSGTAINDGRWHHVAATREWRGRVQLYLDGKCEATGAGPTGTRDATPSLFLGVLRAGFRYFQGDIDDVRIYDHVLSLTDIAVLQDVTPPQPSPARFALAPTALSSTSVTMTAVAGTDEHGSVQYHFEEMTAKSGVRISEWQTDPQYVDTGLQPDTTYAYTVTLRDAVGNETIPGDLVMVHTTPSQ
jgi:hypothetical protein